MKATFQRAREARLFNTEHLPGTWDPPGGKVSHGHISGRNKAALAVQQLVPHDLEVGMTNTEKCIYFCCSSRHLGRQRRENGDVKSLQPQRKKKNKKKNTPASNRMKTARKKKARKWFTHHRYIYIHTYIYEQNQTCNM